MQNLRSFVLYRVFFPTWTITRRPGAVLSFY